MGQAPFVLSLGEMLESAKMLLLSRREQAGRCQVRNEVGIYREQCHAALSARLQGFVVGG